MADRFARANGNFNHAIWAATAGGVAGSASAPTIGDNAIINGFTVTLSGSVACDGLFGTGRGGASASGSVIIADGVTLNCSASGIHGISSSGSNLNVSIDFVSYSGESSVTIIAKEIVGGGGNWNNTISNLGSGTLNIITDNLRVSSGAAQAVYNKGVGNINITASLINSTTSNGVSNCRIMTNDLGNMNIICAGFNGTGSPGILAGCGICNRLGGVVTVIGNVIANTAPAVLQEGTGRVSIIGSATAASGSAAVAGGGLITISGNILNAANGTQAIYAPSYRIDPIPTNGYIRYARNGTGIGSDAWLYQFTTDSLSAFSMPPVSSVRFGTTFANATLTGTCVIPSPSSVTFGVPTDNTTGIALLAANTLFDVPIASLTATNSLGERLKNSATVESVGRIISSFSN